MSLAQWSQAHGQQREQAVSDCQPLAEASSPSKKPSDHAPRRFSAAPIADGTTVEGGRQ